MMKLGVEVTINTRRYLRLVYSINLDNARVWKRGRDKNKNDEMPATKAL